MISSSVCFFFSSSNSSVRSSPSSPLLSFFLVVSVVVKGEESSKRKKLAKFLTSFRLAKPLLRLAKEEDGSTNIFFAPSLSPSLFLRRTCAPPRADREKERESKRCAFFFSRGYFWSFFLNFFSREIQNFKIRDIVRHRTSTKSLIII